MIAQKKALCIVAHPDDETIWMGGTILNNREWEWTILSLCRGNDSDRAPKFRKVCEEYGAIPIISDLDDEVLKPISSTQVTKKIMDNLPEKHYDYIFTHGENGEYGHIRHREIHRAVRRLITKKQLSCEKLYSFSYEPGEQVAPHDPGLKIPVPKSSADLVVSLNKNQFNRKVGMITKIYGFRHPIFETLSCSKKESFVEIK